MLSPAKRRLVHFITRCSPTHRAAGTGLARTELDNMHWPIDSIPPCSRPVLYCSQFCVATNIAMMQPNMPLRYPTILGLTSHCVGRDVSHRCSHIVYIVFKRLGTPSYLPKRFATQSEALDFTRTKVGLLGRHLILVATPKFRRRHGT